MLPGGVSSGTSVRIRTGKYTKVSRGEKREAPPVGRATAENQEGRGIAEVCKNNLFPGIDRASHR